MFKEWKELAVPIADRIRNPFFGSVFTAWLLVNWKLIVVAVSDTDNYLDIAGVKTYIDYVLAAGSFRLAVLPVLMGMGYMLLLPFLRMWYGILNTWISQKSSEKKAKIMRGHFVPVEKLLELREDYRKRIKEAAELVAGEGKFREQAAAAESRRKEAEEALEKLNGSLRANAGKLAKMNLQSEWYVERDMLGVLFRYHIHIDLKKKTATYANEKDAVAFVFREVFYQPETNKAHILMMPMESPFTPAMINSQWLELDFGPEGDYVSAIVPFTKVFTRLKFSRRPFQARPEHAYQSRKVQSVRLAGEDPRF